MGTQYPALAEFRRIAEANRPAGPARSKPQPSFYSKRPPAYTTNWTDERKELLKKFWADGLSASQIATKLGEVTRNAVIGMVHRMGLAGRARSSRTRTARPRSIIRTFSPIFIYARPIGPHKPAQILVPVLAPAPEGAITLANIGELTETMCHWPIGDPQENGFHYCSRRKSRDASYCEHHATFAYRPSQRKPKPKGNGFYWIDLAGRSAR